MLTYKDYLKIISKDELIEKYEHDNLSATECQQYFNISSAIFFRLLRIYEIHKSKESHNSRIKQSKLEKYGDPNYNNQPQRAKTNIEKYGVDNQFKRQELFASNSELKLLRYGSKNNIVKNHQTRADHYGSDEQSYKEQQVKHVLTCLNRYGVTNPAKLEETKEKIRSSLKNTFQELYGVDYYWAKPDAIRSNGSKDSKANQAFAELLDSNNISYTREFLLDGRYFDFKVGSTLIEINPTATHNITWSPFSDTGIAEDYHRMKTDIAIKNNYRCIHIFDWNDPDKIIMLLKRSESIYARNCEIRKVDLIEAKQFINEYHIQGYARDSIRYGLYYNNSLVSIMTFGKPRYTKKYEYELIRYCSKINVTGGAEKLFKHFIREINPQSIISYCNLNVFRGDLYVRLGFKQLRKPTLSCHWYNIKTKKHVTDNLLRQLGYDRIFNTNYGKGTDNNILMLNSGFVQIIDAGQAVFGWKR